MRKMISVFILALTTGMIVKEVSAASSYYYGDMNRIGTSTNRPVINTVNTNNGFVRPTVNTVSTSNVMTARSTTSTDSSASNGGWYVIAKGGVNLLNHGYSVPDENVDSKVSFGRQFMYELSIGKKFRNRWAIQADAGMLTKYEDTESFQDAAYGLKFSESSQYAALGGVYSFPSGVYFGAGAGFVMTETGLNIVGSENATSSSVLADAFLGYEWKIAGNLSIDFGFKTMVYWGEEIEYKNLPDVQIGTGMVWNVAGVVGARYNF